MLVDIIGISGVALIVVTYLMLHMEKINHKGFLFSFLNMLGSLLIIFSILNNWNLASFIIEFFWVCISLYGLYKWYKNK